MTTTPCASCNVVRDWQRREVAYDKVVNRCRACGRVYESVVTIVKKEGK